MPSVIAYGCDDATTQFHPLQIDIREPGEGEIYFDVAYAGICHSDIHAARGEWGPVSYPLVPGHEFVGTDSPMAAMPEPRWTEVSAVSLEKAPLPIEVTESGSVAEVSAVVSKA